MATLGFNPTKKTCATLNLLSTYRPQTHGQSEISDLTIIYLLKSYVMEVDKQDQWERSLPMVEYV